MKYHVVVTKRILKILLNKHSLWYLKGAFIGLIGYSNSYFGY